MQRIKGPILLLGGAVVSVGLGVFFYLETDLAPAMATFAGLLGMVLTF